MEHVHMFLRNHAEREKYCVIAKWRHLTKPFLNKDGTSDSDARCSTEKLRNYLLPRNWSLALIMRPLIPRKGQKSRAGDKRSYPVNLSRLGEEGSQNYA